MGWGAISLPAAGAARERGLGLRAVALARAAVAAAAAALAVYAVAHCAVEAARAPGGREAAGWAALGLAAGAPAIVALVAWRGIGRFALTRPAGVIIAACVLFQGLLASGSYFSGDDWLHLVKADAASGPDAAYLGMPVFIHYAPGLRAGYWALEHLAPLDWNVGLAALLVLLAGSLVLFHRITLQLFGERRVGLVALLLFGSSVTLVTSFLWFADGLHKLPSTFLTLLAIHAWLRHREEDSKVQLAIAVAAVGLGLLFYVKVILVPLYLLLIDGLLLGRRPRWTLLAFVPPIAIYLWNYEAGYAALAGSHPPFALVARYVWIAWYRGVAPALTGVYVGLDQRTLAIVVAVAAQLVIAAIAYRTRDAWRAWAFALIVFLVNAAMIGFGRLESFGFERVAWDPRYNTELAWLLPLALAAALKGFTWRRRSVGVVGVYAILAVVTGTLMSLWWRDTQSRAPTAFVENLHSDATARTEIIDQPVPQFLVAAVDYPWDRLSRLAPALGLNVVQRTGQPRIVGADGHVRPARLYPAGATLRLHRRCGVVDIPGGTPSLYAEIGYGERHATLVSLAAPLRLTLPAGECVRNTAVGWLGPA
ncbi:MAG: hypothetical protein QOG63_823 [Thermoleophilaceae bacterium]|nr:hypothetical protein [Thermoleophilaceae bacterium]